MGGWIEKVLAARPRIAIFDCDGTLWSGDAGSGFMQWTLDHGLAPEKAAASLQARYRAYEAGEVDEATICGEMVQVYAGLQENEVREAARKFVVEQVEPRIFPEMEALVTALRKDGAEIWAVSSTCDWVIEAGLSVRFGIGPDRILAARVRSRDGLVTDELLAVPTDEAKVAALQAAGVSRPDAVFGNSVHDLAMLLMGRAAYPVNPTEALLAHAKASGWPVFRPRGTT